MVFNLPLPVSTNRAYATNRGRWFKIKKQKDWEEEAGKELMRQMSGQTGYYGYNTVRIRWFFNRDRDIDGGIKSILDLLQRMGIYSNDSVVTKLEVTKCINKENPHVFVEVL